MKKINWIFLILTLGFISCTKEVDENLMHHTVIPEPVEISVTNGFFLLNGDTKFLVKGDSIDFEIEYFKNIIKNLLGVNIQKTSEAEGQVIFLDLDPSLTIGREAYEIIIEPEKIHLKSSSRAGLYYAIQTFRQLLPASVEDIKPSKVHEVKIPAGKIIDFPDYAYRGMMLDVARHFFKVEEVKVLIDRLAKYKINHLHLHLSDDQGWRIEIKSWPLLTTIGGSTAVGGGEGGFYTQDDYREIVEYAMQRHITIVPEIDLPGHTNSVLASYGILNPGIIVPEANSFYADRNKLGVLSEDNEVSPLYTGIEVGFSHLDTHNNLTYEFVEDVIREISALTPGPYFHVGGDETLVVPKDDYVSFMEKTQDIVLKYGKKSIGWDEMAQSRMLEGNVAQYWAREENALLSIEQGNQILISPATKIYLDMQYNVKTKIGLHWAAYVEVDDSYLWDPLDLIKGLKKEHILGIEAPMWSETITTRSEMEYMIFPRLTAAAEIAWSPKERRSWENYQRKIKAHYIRWDNMGINYYKSPKIK